MNEAHPISNVKLESIVTDPRQRAQLNQMAAAIAKEVATVEARLDSAVRHALNAGKLLCKAKSLAGHGNWLAWFEASQFSFSESSAQRYMRLYRQWPNIMPRIKNMAQLTINGALELVSDQETSSPNGTNQAEQIETAKGTLLIPSDQQTSSPAAPNKGKIMALRQTLAPLSVASANKTFDGWLTPNAVADAAVEMLGVIDLDPASDGQHIPAERHLTLAEDGLAASNAWHGRVFLNPPVSSPTIDCFMDRLVEEQRAGKVTEGIALVPALTDAPWMRKLRSCVRCFIARPELGQFDHAPGPLVALYVGERHERFCQCFSILGDVFVPYRAGGNSATTILV